MSPENIVPLLIITPLLGASLPLIAQFTGRAISGHISIVVMSIHSALSLILLKAMFESERIIYEIGGSTFGRQGYYTVGVELLADNLSTSLVLLTSIVGLTTIIYAFKSGEAKSTTFSGILILLGGITGMILTHDIFNLFVFMEITGIAAYALIATGKSKSALSSLKYLLAGTVGASLYLLGVGFLYMATGTLNMTDLANVLSGVSFVPNPLYEDPLVKMSFGLMITGLMIKSAIFPLHTWQPSAYDKAPNILTPLIASVISTASVYVIIRIIFDVFTIEFFSANPAILNIVMLLSGLSVIAGSILAVTQTNIKRILAYSSVAQFGLIIISMNLAAQNPAAINSLIGGITHLIGHGIMKAGLFTGAGILIAAASSKKLQEMQGIGKKLKTTPIAFAILGIALIGIPPSIGFLGKWYMLLGAIETGSTIVTSLILFSTLLTLAYTAKIIEAFYFKNKRGNKEFEFDNLRLTAYIVAFYAISAIILGFTGTLFFEFFEIYGMAVLR